MNQKLESLKVLIIIAMRAEAESLIKEYGLEVVENCTRHPYQFFTRAGVSHSDFVLVTSGCDETYGVDNVATQNAAAMTALGLQMFWPDVVINAGTAGGFIACGAKIGSVYLGSEFIYHDRRIPIPGFASYGVGGYQMFPPPDLRRKYPSSLVSTGNSLDIKEEERLLLSRLSKNGVVVKDMEGTAIAEMCWQTKTPMIALKAVTDLIDGDRCSQEEFLQNLTLASQSLNEAVRFVLSQLDLDMIKQIVPCRAQLLVEQVLSCSVAQ